jgi:hypothetical protein
VLNKPTYFEAGFVRARLLWKVALLGDLRDLTAVGHFCYFVGANVAHPDWTISVAVALIGAFVIWILARAVRYLAGLQPKRGLS